MRRVGIQRVQATTPTGVIENGGMRGVCGCIFMESFALGGLAGSMSKVLQLGFVFDAFGLFAVLGLAPHTVFVLSCCSGRWCASEVDLYQGRARLREITYEEACGQGTLTPAGKSLCCGPRSHSDMEPIGL